MNICNNCYCETKENLFCKPCQIKDKITDNINPYQSSSYPKLNLDKLCKYLADIEEK